jgi:hypothetical protein
VRVGLVGLLVPALLVAACGSEVKPPAATPTPTASLGLPFPVVTDTATPAPDAPTPTVTPTAVTSATGTPSPTASPTPSTAPSSSTALGRDARLLVGWWRVATSAGQADLGLGEDGRVVVASCSSDVTWAASPTGLFVAASYGYDGGCSGQRPDLRWLEGAFAFAVSTDRLLLVDASGTAVARGTREQPPSGHEAFTVPPGLKARLADAKQLPQGVRPVTATQLQRRWVPKGQYSGGGKAFVTFGKDRAWTGSDGCNGAGGRYGFGDFGEVVSIAGASTQIGCQNSPAPQWVTKARRLGLVEGVLALYDGNATLLGRLYPA